MAVYKVDIVGRSKPFLLRAGSKTDVIKMVLDAEALTGEEVEEALSNGEKLWKAGEPLPADDKVPDDVAALVVAARRSFDGDGTPEELDAALEPFSSRVRYENETTQDADA